jgi:hypothetical protein
LRHRPARFNLAPLGIVVPTTDDLHVGREWLTHRLPHYLRSDAAGIAHDNCEAGPGQR